MASALATAGKLLLTIIVAVIVQTVLERSYGRVKSLFKRNQEVSA